MKKVILIGALATTILASCKKDNVNESEKNGIFKGPVSQIFSGQAWTWAEIEKSGKPKRLAVALTDEALNSVPVGDAGHGGAHGHGDMTMWTLKFHSKAKIDPFNHLNLGWNPKGHEPEMIYGKPHFDFHFYTMTPGEVAAIPAYEADSAKFNNWPAPAYFPATYFNPGGGVPQMGAHWLDVTSGELNGQPFTETFIFGSFNGKVNFYEPMITLDFLKQTSNFERAIPQPEKFQQTGYYPTKMQVMKHDGVTEVILDGFEYRTAS